MGGELEFDVSQLVRELAAAVAGAQELGRNGSAGGGAPPFEIAEASIELPFATVPPDEKGKGVAGGSLRVRIDTPYLEKVRPEAVGKLRVRLAPSPGVLTAEAGKSR